MPINTTLTLIANIAADPENWVNAITNKKLKSTVLMDVASQFSAAESAVQLIQLLINRGANVNALDSRGRNALMIAIAEENYQIASALIKAGTNLKQRDKDGQNVLHYIFTRGAGSLISGIKQYDLIEELLQNGANPNVQDKRERKTAMNLALDECSEKVYHEEATHMFYTMLDHGADINKLDGDGKSLLFMSVKIGALEIASKLIELGADTGENTSLKFNPFLTAIEDFELDIATEMVNSEQGVIMSKDISKRLKEISSEEPSRFMDEECRQRTAFINDVFASLARVGKLPALEAS